MKKINEIRVEDIDTEIELKGIPYKLSPIRPIVLNIKYSCPSCGTIISVLQTNKVPIRCACGRKGRFILINKDFIDSATFILSDDPWFATTQPSIPSSEIEVRISGKRLTDPKKLLELQKQVPISILGIVREIKGKFCLEAEAFRLEPIKDEK